MKKWGKWIVIAIVLFWVITAPQGAADTAQRGGSTLKEAGNSATTFLTELSR